MKAPKFVVSGTYCCLKTLSPAAPHLQFSQALPPINLLQLKKKKNLRDVWGKGSDEISLIPEEETISHYKDDCPCVLLDTNPECLHCCACSEEEMRCFPTRFSQTGHLYSKEEVGDYSLFLL